MKLRLLALAFLSFAAASCEGRAPDAQLVVFAASSLVDVLADAERAYEERNPGLDVVVATAGSQALRLQIEQGADADVFVSANAAHVESLRASGLLSDAATVATNSLAIATPAHDETVVDFESLPRAQRLVVGARGVPAGDYARELFERARGRYGDEFADELQARVVSEEPNVRLILAKVALGEADAAIVYRTDVAASTRTRFVEVPRDLSPPIDYRVGIVVASDRRAPALGFRDFLLSDEGQALLAGHGFEAPR